MRKIKKLCYKKCDETAFFVLKNLVVNLVSESTIKLLGGIYDNS
jgi:hypothetical protein